MQADRNKDSDPTPKLEHGEYTIPEDHGYSTRTLNLVLDQGRFSVTTDGVGEIASGSFTITENKITFTEEVVSPKEKSVCGSKDTYSYLWTFDTKKGELRFMRDKDDCEARAFANIGGMEARPWQFNMQGNR